jgi:hypothetical protein
LGFAAGKRDCIGSSRVGNAHELIPGISIRAPLFRPGVHHTGSSPSVLPSFAGDGSDKPQRRQREILIGNTQRKVRPDCEGGRSERPREGASLITHALAGRGVSLSLFGVRGVRRCRG